MTNPDRLTTFLNSAAATPYRTFATVGAAIFGLFAGLAIAVTLLQWVAMFLCHATPIVLLVLFWAWEGFFLGCRVHEPMRVVRTFVTEHTSRSERFIYRLGAFIGVLTLTVLWNPWHIDPPVWPVCNLLEESWETCRPAAQVFGMELLVRLYYAGTAILISMLVGWAVATSVDWPQVVANVLNRYSVPVIIVVRDDDERR